MIKQDIVAAVFKKIKELRKKYDEAEAQGKEKSAYVPSLKVNDVKEIVESLLTTIESSLVRGEAVKIVGFGVFEVRNHASRTGRNPQNPSEKIEIPARRVAAFRAGKLLKASVDVTVKTGKAATAGKADKAAAKPATAGKTAKASTAVKPKRKSKE